MKRFVNKERFHYKINHDVPRHSLKHYGRQLRWLRNNKWYTERKVPATFD